MWEVQNSADLVRVPVSRPGKGKVHALLCPKWNWTLGSSCQCHHEKLHMVFTLPMVRRFT